MKKLVRRMTCLSATFGVAVSLLGLSTPANASVDGGCIPQDGYSVGLETAVGGDPTGQFRDNPPPQPAGYQRIWDGGSAWADMQWRPGPINTGGLDARIERVRKISGKNTKILYVFGLTPRWAAADPNAGTWRNGSLTGIASPPKDMALWDDFVTQLVTNFGDRIDAYEMWNEANLKTFWQGTPEEMAEMTARGANIIRTLDPTATILAPSTTTRLQTSMYNWSQQFVPALIERGLPVDGFAIHSYPAGDLPTPEAALAARTADVRYWQATMRDLLRPVKGASARQVWDTELNYGLAGPGPKRPGRDFTSYEDMRKLLINSYTGSQWMGITQTTWFSYSANDFPLFGVQFTPTLGLSQSNGLLPAPWEENWTETSTGQSRGCSAEARDQQLAAGDLQQDVVTSTPQDQSLRVDASRNPRQPRVVRVNITSTGLPEGYPVKVQFKRPGQIVWSTKPGRPRLDSNGEATVRLTTRQDLTVRVVTESGNIKSNSDGA